MTFLTLVYGIVTVLGLVVALVMALLKLHSTLWPEPVVVHERAPNKFSVTDGAGLTGDISFTYLTAMEVDDNDPAATVMRDAARRFMHTTLWANYSTVRNHLGASMYVAAEEAHANMGTTKVLAVYLRPPSLPEPSDEAKHVAAMTAEEYNNQLIKKQLEGEALKAESKATYARIAAKDTAAALATLTVPTAPLALQGILAGLEVSAPQFQLIVPKGAAPARD